MVSEPDPDLRAISRSLGRDPALTMRLLAAVNSGYYSLRSPITSVDRAVSFLGAQTLRSMMVCLLLKQVVAASRLGQYQLRTFWEGSLRRAVAARQLARASTMAAPDECFTIGLCQDFGLLLQISRDPRQSQFYSDITVLPHQERLRLERTSGTSHDELGASWLMSWQCPNAIVVPIRHHHDPELSPIELRPLAEIAQAAEFVADLWAVEERRLAVEDAEHALGELGLTCTHLESIVESINSEMSDACTMLGLDANLVSGFNPLHDELPERGHKVANR